MTMSAAALNAKWSALTDQLDAYYNQIPATVAKAVNAAVSRWQDFYYGTSDWQASAVENWAAVYEKAKQTLSAAIPTGAVKEAATKATSNRTATAQPLYVTAAGSSSGSMIPDFGLPPWWWWALSSVPALAILYITRKRG